jgi:anti-sigma-K factor RskA
VQATAAVEQSADHDYELWIVAADGRAPISLGVVPESGVLDVPRHDAFDNLQIAALAISLEQPGGSVTGLPGQVLYTATLTTL